MNILTKALRLVLWSSLAGSVFGATAGFTEPDVLFYGTVHRSGGGQTVLLQSGHLRMTFANQSNPDNRVTLETDLYPVGSGAIKSFSYSLRVPLAYLPDPRRIDEFLSVTTLPTNFKIEEISIDGVPATLPDGSKEFYTLSFASRSGDYRLDLLVEGDSISSAHDGIPDWWKRIHGLDTSLDVSGDDPDADGWTNLEEFLRGGNPNVSNREPLLVTAEIDVPESGQAGVYLQFLDSDSSDSDIELSFSGLDTAGFELRFDGAAVPQDSSTQCTLADIKSGRLSVIHKQRDVASTSLAVTWNDGGTPFSGDILLTAAAPSLADGSDSALWLDGNDLPATGTRFGNWPDRSGNGRSAMQPLADFQPTARDKSADFSTHSLSHLFFQDSALPAGNHTVLVAYRAAGSADEAQTILSTNRGHLQITPTSRPVSYPGAPVYQVDGLAVRGYDRVAGATVTSTFRRENGLLQNIFGLSYHGENLAASPLDPVLPTLGTRRSAIEEESEPIRESFRGLLHEMLVFPIALPEQKLRNVHDYLESKWAGAVVWNFSTELKTVVLSPGQDGMRRIIRGGFASDQLHGGTGGDILSGGAGDDRMSGGAGPDRFLFGELDTGRKTITDFDPQVDIIDLSALFWGMTGDARQYLSVRLDTNYSTPVPTLDSVIVIQRPGSENREIVLSNTVVGSTQLIRHIVEGRICAGSLSIPSSVQIALAPGNPPTGLTESLHQSFSINLTRSGAGSAARLDVPIGFLEGSLGGRFVVDNASSSEGQRAVVTLDRGVTSKTITVHPVPDLETTGTTNWQVAVLPQYTFSVAGSPVQQTVSDAPKVWVEVTQPNAVASPAQPARIKIHRDGNLSQSLTVDFQLGGTATNGVHIQSIPTSVSIFAGQSSREIQISARAAGLTSGPKVLLFQLSARERYLVSNPHEALVYVGNTQADAAGAGFDRWLLTATNGQFTNFTSLSAGSTRPVQDYIQAYALGLDSVDELGKLGLSLRIVDHRPELTVPSLLDAADLRWTVQNSADMASWTDVGAQFSSVREPAATRLTGPAIDPAEVRNFYRLDLRLDPGLPAAAGIAGLTGSNQYGLGGTGNWVTDPQTGHLVSSGGNPGDTNRIVAKVSGPSNIHFDMEIVGGDWNDALVFYIDGVRQAETYGENVDVQRTLTGAGSHLLMWEFTRGSGKAVVRNLGQ